MPKKALEQAREDGQVILPVLAWKLPLLYFMKTRLLKTSSQPSSFKVIHLGMVPLPKTAVCERTGSFDSSEHLKGDKVMSCTARAVSFEGPEVMLSKYNLLIPGVFKVSITVA